MASERGASGAGRYILLPPYTPTLPCSSPEASEEIGLDLDRCKREAGPLPGAIVGGYSGAGWGAARDGPVEDSGRTW